MVANIMFGSKFGKSDLKIQKLITAKNPILEKNLKDFHTNIKWLSKNIEQLRVKHGGKFVAVHEKKICITNTNPFKLIKSVKSKYGDDRSVVIKYIGKQRVNLLL